VTPVRQLNSPGRDLSNARHREVWTALYSTARCERLVRGLSEQLYTQTVSASSWEAFRDTLPRLPTLRACGPWGSGRHLSATQVLISGRCWTFPACPRG
jgi:hypothetical protein